MGKKSKEENQSSDIFRTLFGNRPEESGLSLFSDNPFRRNPEQDSAKDQNLQQNPSGLGLHSKEAKPENGNNLGSDLAEVKKKRKRDREKNPTLGLDSAVKDSASGKKRKKLEIDQTVMEKVGEEENSGRKKKKRKRDEIEAEYEAKKYGLIEKVEDEEKEKEKEKGIGGKVVVGEKRKAADESKELVVSKEAYDDESKLRRTVFVGNLPLKLKKKTLVKEFGQFGEIESARIRSVPILDTKMPRKGAVIKGKINDNVDSVHAYIVFTDEQSAQAALSHNMAKVGGNHIRVDRACPPRKKLKEENAPLYDNKRTVFVGNLPFDVKDEELYQLFCGINQLESCVEAVRVIRDPNTSLGKGIAYVLFKTREAANLVKRKHLKLRDRLLRLSHSKSDSTPSKRRDFPVKWGENSANKRSAVLSDENNKPKIKAASLSYQGLQASKSGVQKKVNTHAKTNDGMSSYKRKGAPETKVSKTKRPAVDARKTSGKRPAVAARKANALKGVNRAPAQTGKKRKLDSRTPESAHRNKKVRKFK